MRINKIQWKDYYLRNDEIIKKLNQREIRKINQANVLYLRLCRFDIDEIADILNIKIERVRIHLRNGKYHFNKKRLLSKMDERRN